MRSAAPERAAWTFSAIAAAAVDFFGIRAISSVDILQKKA